MIVRGIRVRAAAVDGINVIKGAYNVLIDHVSIHGSADGNLDIGTGAHDVTVSWSILSGIHTNMLIKYYLFEGYLAPQHLHVGATKKPARGD